MARGAIASTTAFGAGCFHLLGAVSQQLIHGKPAFAAAKAERTAERMLMLYEGAIALWRMTGEESYFQRLERELLESVEPT